MASARPDRPRQLQGIIADNVALPGGVRDGPLYVQIGEDGRVASITKDVSQAPEGTPTCHWLVPGFIDIHTHGLGGASDLCENWLNPQYSAEIFPRAGTTAFLATLTFPKAHPEFVRDTHKAVTEFVELEHPWCARLEGIHAEGPVVASLGGLPEGDPTISVEDFRALINAMPSIKVMTIAPSCEALVDYARLRILLEHGIRPALGHDKLASAKDIIGAMSIGHEFKAQLHVTHAYNVMYFHHRNPGLTNFALFETYPQYYEKDHKEWCPLSVEVIGDFHHCAAENLNLLLTCRDHNNISLVTDSMMDFKPGNKAVYCGRPVHCHVRKTTQSHETGVMMLSETETIAGSCCTMLHNFYNLIRGLGLAVEDASRMMSEVPARVAHLEGIGKIEVGYRADFAVFDKDMKLARTIIDGREVYNYENE